MPLTFKKLHPKYVAQVGDIDLRRVDDRQTLDAIRAGMDEFGVLVFRNQRFSGAEQTDFARRLDGALHAKTGAAVLTKNRLGDEALSDISNVDENGDIMAADDRRRMYSLGNRLWHTDASFQDPPGRYSMLFAVVVPPVPADTEFADMRAAWDALDAATRARLDGLTVHHTITNSRATLGFEFTPQEREKLPGAVHPLVAVNPRTGRRALYLAAHAARIMQMPVPEGRLLLADLTEHATQREFVYRHHWQVGDLVIWDNKATMHRGKSFDDVNHRREMRRVTTLDL